MYKIACDLVHVSSAKKTWTIAAARQSLSEVVGNAAHEPQHIYRRDKLVAAVVSPELAHQVDTLRRPSMATKLAELQRLCAEDGFELTTPARRDRANPVASAPVRNRSRVRRPAKR